MPYFYLILMKNVMGDLPTLKIFLNVVIWCVLPYILSKFHCNMCQKGKEIVKHIQCLATCSLLLKLGGGGGGVVNHFCSYMLMINWSLIITTAANHV